MMIGVAAAALALVVLVPIGRRLHWLYQAPQSFNLVVCNFSPRLVRLAGPAPVGQPISIRCPYKIHISDAIPTGLPYRVSVQILLMDPKTMAVEEAHERVHHVFAGQGELNGELVYDLTPRRPGGYWVRYEAYVSDLFDRNGNVGIQTDGFSAR